MPTPKDEEIKIRVPKAMKTAIKALADQRITSESAIAREALLEYLQARGITIASSVPTPGAEKGSSERILGIVKEHYPAPAKRGAPPKARK